MLTSTCMPMPGLEGSHSWRLASNNWVLYLPVHQWCASIRIKLMKITRTNDHRIARNFFNETFPLRFRDVKVEAINCHCTRQQTENHRSCIHVYTFMYTYVCVIATWYFDHTLNIRSEEGWRGRTFVRSPESLSNLYSGSLNQTGKLFLQPAGEE